TTLKDDLCAAFRVYKVEIEIDFCSSALAQAVLERSLIGRVIAFGEGREVGFALLICDLPHKFYMRFQGYELLKTYIRSIGQSRANPGDQIRHRLGIAPESGD